MLILEVTKGEKKGFKSTELLCFSELVDWVNRDDAEFVEVQRNTFVSLLEWSVQEVNCSVGKIMQFCRGSIATTFQSGLGLPLRANLVSKASMHFDFVSLS